MTGELTLFVLRLGFLAFLWVFVFSIIYSLRSDLFGKRSDEYQRTLEQSRQQTFGAAVNDAGAPVTMGVAAGAAGAGAGAAASAGAAHSTPARPAMPAPTPVKHADDAPTEHVTAPSSSSSTSGPTTDELRAASRATRLIITSGPRKGTEVALGAIPVTIGRHPDSDLVIQDDYSSTHHARLVPNGASWLLEDLSSTNGTYVNGRRLSHSSPLAPGVPVRIGTTTFELRQ